MSKVTHDMRFEDSEVKMMVNPDITNQWHHYETKGVRLYAWGAPLFAFTNPSGQPVTFEIKNVQLIREV